MKRRPLSDLVNLAEPAWPTIQEWIRGAKCPVEVLPAAAGKREAALEEVQVTTRSPMGAVIYESGGVLIDHGFLRVLGSGHPKLPRSLPEWNVSRGDGFLLVADDVVGGFYALDGGAFGVKPGSIHYFAPDSLRWEPLDEMGYSDFLAWAMSGRLNAFYESMRWPGWEKECALVRGDQALSIWPPLWTKEGKDISKASRRPVPIHEVYDLNVNEYPKQLDS